MDDCISQKMSEGVVSGVFPGAVLLVARQGNIVYHKPFGLQDLELRRSEVACNTLFDIASLTKPLATAAAIVLLIQEGSLNLDDPVSRHIPSYASGGKAGIRLFHLLNHCAGLPDWRPYYKSIAKRDEADRGFLGSPEAKHLVYQMARNEALISSPGELSLYSDIGFIVLGEVIELVSGMSLNQFCETQIFSLLHDDRPFFSPLNDPAFDRLNQSIAATEHLSWRGGFIRGIVHDDNAYAMGGLAGHAGLFSTAMGVYQLVQLWRKSLKEEGPFDPKIANHFLSRKKGSGFPKESSWGLGWDTPSSLNSSSGQFFSESSFGHLGYTGTSIWVDQEKDLTVILLTNRVHPSHENRKIKIFRPELHNVVFKEILGESLHKA